MYLVNTTVFNVTRLIQIDKHIFLLCVLDKKKLKEERKVFASEFAFLWDFYEENEVVLDGLVCLVLFWNVNFWQ